MGLAPNYITPPPLLLHPGVFWSRLDFCLLGGKPITSIMNRQREHSVPGTSTPGRGGKRTGEEEETIPTLVLTSKTLLFRPVSVASSLIPVWLTGDAGVHPLQVKTGNQDQKIKRQFTSKIRLKFWPTRRIKMFLTRRDTSRAK